MAKLIFTGAKFAGRVYTLALETTTVGRGDHNTLAIHDVSVSQTHCEILVNGPEVIVRDLGSSNGTFANGTRLRSQQCQLLSGQIVKFGAVEARLEIDEPASSDTDTDVTAVHLHARLLREQQQSAAPQPTPGMILETGSAGTSGDHTLMLPRSAATEPKSVPPSGAPTPSLPQLSNRMPLLLLVAALVLGLALLLWLLLGRS